MATAKVGGVKFSDGDVVNLNDFIGAGEDNPNNVHGYLLHDQGRTLAVVAFASTLDDALNIAADKGMLDRFKLTAAELADGKRIHQGAGISYLGKNKEPFDVESLGIIELSNPPRSFVAEYNAKFDS